LEKREGGNHGGREGRRVNGGILVVKWDALYGRLLGDAVQGVFPAARIVVERSVSAGRCRVAAETFDLVILGLSFADGDGLTWLQELATQARAGSILTVTLRRDAQVLALLRRTRTVSAFDPSGDDPARFTLALAHAAQGRRYLSASLQEALLGGAGAALDFGRVLTPTEWQVLAVIGDGSDDKAASAALGLEPGSVHSHRKRLMRKLGVQSRNELFRRALELGVVRVLPDGRVVRSMWELVRSEIEAGRTRRERRRGRGPV
jgi:DNA-binding NarL/FixJ family response regulator